MDGATITMLPHTKQGSDRMGVTSELLAVVTRVIVQVDLGHLPYSVRVVREFALVATSTQAGFEVAAQHTLRIHV